MLRTIVSVKNVVMLVALVAITGCTLPGSPSVPYPLLSVQGTWRLLSITSSQCTNTANNYDRSCSGDTCIFTLNANTFSSTMLGDGAYTLRNTLITLVGSKGVAQGGYSGYSNYLLITNELENG